MSVPARDRVGERILILQILTIYLHKSFNFCTFEDTDIACGNPTSLAFGTRRYR